MSKWAVSKNSLEQVHSLLFGWNGMEDVVFVAINFKGDENIRNGFQTSRKAQLGIATLDTRDVRLHLQGQGPESIIKTKCFSTDPSQTREHLIRQFSFGTVETISIYDLATKLRQYLKFYDEEGKERKLVLAFHQHCEDGNLPYCLRVSKKHDYTSSSLMTIVETTQMMCTYLGRPRSKPLGLFDECLELGIPEHRAHRCAGNCANLTLKVALMVAVRTHEKLRTGTPYGKLVDVLKKYCQAPIPPRRTEAELEGLRALIPTSPIDDPQVPIDASRFCVRYSKRQSQLKRREERRAERDWILVQPAEKKGPEERINEVSDGEDWTSHAWAD